MRSAAHSCCRPTVGRLPGPAGWLPGLRGSCHGQLGQCRFHLHRGGPEARIFGQHVLDQSFQGGRDLRVQTRGRHRRLRDNGVQDADLRVGAEGVLPGGQLVQHQAERKDVGGGVHRFGPRLLRRHVEQCADPGARVRTAAARRGALGSAGGKAAGQAEVEHLHDAVVAHHEVRGLDVAMDDAGGMGGRQRLGRLPEQPGQFFHGPALADQRLQGPPFDQLHAEKGPAGGLPGVIDRADVRVVQGAGGAGLAAEARQPYGVPGTLLGQELQGDGPVEAVLPGLVHHPHAAAAEQAQDLVAGDLGRGLGAGRPDDAACHRRRPSAARSCSASSARYWGKRCRYSSRARPGSRRRRNSCSAAISSRVAARSSASSG